jgi:hypothetical protein
MTFVASVFFMHGRIWEKARRIFTYEGEIRPHSGEVRDISAASSGSLPLPASWERRIGDIEQLPIRAHDGASRRVLGLIASY